ncbi:ABC transporter permease [Acidiferrimicrobium sp. IK]|uniref:ABC transporter permease n=1 Tax=Acidiferrimicrobium sp. IK TaxID=2871700 RepID=UPI0021CB6193|nr:ABC transporter permease [Acidiferrimicrobium sp. IK]MCU4186107.1 ABC transporter permease [Acidiferrimicrobium sp. IK]
MSWLENVRISLRGLNANKLRSSLTVLGILIGVGAVIILVAVGTGSSQAVQNRIKALGTNTITVLGTGRFGRGPATTGTQTRAATLTAADVGLLQDRTQAPDILTVSPVDSTSVTATNGAATSTMTVTGTTPTYIGASDFQLQAGRNLTSSDVTAHTRVAVVGTTLVSDLFSAGANPIGSVISLGSLQVQIVGVLATKGSTGNNDPNAVAIIPYTTAQDRLTGYSASFSELIVQSRSSSDINAAESEAASILAGANHTTVSALPFNFLNEGSLLSTSQSTNQTFTVLLGAVAAISLLVGGIGIMNIMLVTVTERTREIGIRKAIGAPKSAILGQFLTEAVILSLIGGVAGVIIGVAGSHFRIVGVQPVLSWQSIVEAFGVAVAVGVFFGFYPANRAASMRPIDALRYE